MGVKNYEETVKAIHNIVHGAKIPVITMVAILEVTKYQLLETHSSAQNAKEAAAYFAMLQEEAQKKAASRGVS